MDVYTDDDDDESGEEWDRYCGKNALNNGYPIPIVAQVSQIRHVVAPKRRVANNGLRREVERRWDLTIASVDSRCGW